MIYMDKILSDIVILLDRYHMPGMNALRTLQLGYHYVSLFELGSIGLLPCHGHNFLMLMLLLILLLTFSYLFLFIKDKVYSLHVLAFSKKSFRKVYRYCSNNLIPGTLAKSNSAWRTNCLARSPVTSSSSAI